MGRLNYLPLFICTTMILSGCNSIAQLPETPSKIHETIPSSPSPFPTVSMKESNSCNQEPININASGIKNYSWGDNGNEIYFQTHEPGWFLYSISQDKISRIQGYPPQISSPRPPETITQIENVENIIPSPDGGDYIYTIRSENNMLSIYFIAGPENSPVYIGSISGKVNSSYWFTSKEKVLLAVDWQSPLKIGDGYIFTVDLARRNIVALLPNTDEFRNSSYVGVSPDEQWLLFVRFSGINRNIILKNVNTGKQIESTLHNPIDFKWLTKENKLVAVTFFRTGNLDFQIFPVIYDFDSQTEIKMTTDPLPISLNREFETTISPNLNYIAYIGEGEKLFLVDCTNLMSGIK